MKTAATLLAASAALLTAGTALAQAPAPAARPAAPAAADPTANAQATLNPAKAPVTPLTPALPDPKLTPEQVAAAAHRPNPGAIPFSNFDAIPWSGTAGRGNQTFALYGSPTQPGPYAILMKWWPGSFSSPHFHTETRYITVVEGTWWVSDSTKKDMSTLYPLPAGSVVRDEANTIHWDGSQGAPVILQISGNGPARSIGVDEAGKRLPPRPPGQAGGGGGGGGDGG